jgi:hypothetical protein
MAIRADTVSALTAEERAEVKQELQELEDKLDRIHGQAVTTMGGLEKRHEAARLCEGEIQRLKELLAR